MDSERLSRLADSAVRMGFVQASEYGFSLRPQGPIIGDEAMQFAEKIALVVEMANLDICPSSNWLGSRSARAKDYNRIERELIEVVYEAGSYARELLRQDNAARGRLAQRERALIDSIRALIAAAPHRFKV